MKRPERAPSSRGPRRGGGAAPRPRAPPRVVEARAVAAALTVLLHALVVVALLRATTGAPEPPQPPGVYEIGAETLRDAGERIVSVAIVGPALSTHAVLCPGSTYVGVGVTADPRTQRIILVGDDTPASRAGLQHDDIVLNPEVWNDAHREGALLRVLIVREGVKMIVPVRVGWICIG